MKFFKDLSVATYKHIEEQIEIVKQVATCVIYQGFGHRLVAEKFVGKAFLNFISNNACLEVAHLPTIHLKYNLNNKIDLFEVVEGQ